MVANKKVCRKCEIREDLHRQMFGKGFEKGLCVGCLQQEQQQANRKQDYDKHTVAKIMNPRSPFALDNWDAFSGGAGSGKYYSYSFFPPNRENATQAFFIDYLRQGVWKLQATGIGANYHGGLWTQHGTYKTPQSAAKKAGEIWENYMNRNNLKANPKINERKMSKKVFDLYKDSGNKLPAHTGYGGYPVFYATTDGATLCNKCATDYIKGKTSGQEIWAYDANWEDPSMYCDDCGKRIPSAYAEDEVENPRNMLGFRRNSQQIENPRKISSEAARAFGNRRPYKSGNTQVKLDYDGNWGLFLHNNEIAKWRDDGLWITDAGWNTSTTKERLNALPSVNIYQKNYDWYLNGKKWNGNWVNVLAYAENPKRSNPTKQLPAKYADVSVSHGTLNEEHLLDAYIDFAEDVKSYIGNKVNLREAKQVLKSLKNFNRKGDYVSAKSEEIREKAIYILEEFEDAFNEIAPEGTAFTTNEGDGSDFGFWSYWD